MPADIDVKLNFSDDETLSFALVFEMQDGSAFPFSSYGIEMALRDEFDCEKFTLSTATGGGITTNPPYAMFRAEAGTLDPGRYVFGVRVRSTSDGSLTHVLDGEIKVREGNFR